MRFFRIITCKRVFLNLLFLAISFAAYICIFVRIPFDRALRQEQTYFAELNRIDKLTSKWYWDPELKAKTGKLHELSYNDRLSSLIHDVAQLQRWGYDQHLDLYEDGSAQNSNQKFWIHVGGKAYTRNL
jgi:hypothetical protein